MELALIPIILKNFFENISNYFPMENYSTLHYLREVKKKKERRKWKKGTRVKF